jgi:RNA polymerase sigma factor (sigma-70 family)
MYARKCCSMPSAELSDTVLVQRVTQGDQQAFEALVQRYTPPLFNFIRRYVKDYEQSNDIVQHVFFQFYLHIAQLNSNLSTLRTREPIKAWLYQVAWNRSMDELRKKKPILFSDLALGDEEEEWSFLETIPDPYPLPEEVAEQSDMQKGLQQAIQTLPSKFRRIVILRYREELTFVEIGQMLNIPQNTAKTYFQRARPLLRNALIGQKQSTTAS